MHSSSHFVSFFSLLYSVCRGCPFSNLSLHHLFPGISSSLLSSMSYEGFPSLYASPNTFSVPGTKNFTPFLITGFMHMHPLGHDSAGGAFSGLFWNACPVEPRAVGLHPLLDQLIPMGIFKTSLILLLNNTTLFQVAIFFVFRGIY